MISNLIVPKKIQEIFLGKELHSRQISTNFDKFLRYLDIRKNSKMVVSRADNSFRIKYIDGIVKNYYKTTFHGKYLKHEAFSYVEGRFKYDLKIKIMTSIFLILFICIPFLSSDLIAGIIASYVWSAPVL